MPWKHWRIEGKRTFNSLTNTPTNSTAINLRNKLLGKLPFYARAWYDKQMNFLFCFLFNNSLIAPTREYLIQIRNWWIISLRCMEENKIEFQKQRAKFHFIEMLRFCSKYSKIPKTVHRQWILRFSCQLMISMLWICV